MQQVRTCNCVGACAEVRCVCAEQVHVRQRAGHRLVGRWPLARHLAPAQRLGGVPHLGGLHGVCLPWLTLLCLGTSEVVHATCRAIPRQSAAPPHWAPLSWLQFMERSASGSNFLTFNSSGTTLQARSYTAGGKVVTFDMVQDAPMMMNSADGNHHTTAGQQLHSGRQVGDLRHAVRVLHSRQGQGVHAVAVGARRHRDVQRAQRAVRGATAFASQR